VLLGFVVCLISWAGPAAAQGACEQLTGLKLAHASVTSAGLFVAADAGRQFRVGSSPYYTIQTFTNANTIVLDRVYGETTSAVAVAEIFDGYATMPTDFASFRLIPDPYNQRRLAFWITEDQLNLLDPTYQAGDTGFHDGGYLSHSGR